MEAVLPDSCPKGLVEFEQVEKKQNDKGYIWVFKMPNWKKNQYIQTNTRLKIKWTWNHLCGKYGKIKWNI